MRLICLSAEMVLLALGSQMTRSASEPTATAPFLGKMLRMRAQLAEVTETNSSLVIRPVLTPAVHSTGILSSSPPVPFGILVKSVRPSRFCADVKAQWSVATTCSDPDWRPAHKLAWWSFGRNGGDITHRAA